MVIKKQFVLLRGNQNVIDYSLDKYKIKNGQRKTFVVLKLIEDRINHFTKEKTLYFASNLTRIHDNLQEEVVNLPNYLLPGSYNKKSHAAVINIKTDDVSTVDPKTLYANFVYSLTFSWLASGRVKIQDQYAPVISSFILSLLMRLFAKEYGLLGTFSDKIPTLKFLVTMYIYSSFFGISGSQAIQKSIVSSSYQNTNNDILSTDFSSINGLIGSLDSSGVMPGLNKYMFTAKFLRMFGYVFLPALEDLSRFMATIVTSSLRGTSIVPTFISKYNQVEYNKLQELSKYIFRTA